MDCVRHEELEKVLPKPAQCPDQLYFTMLQCCQIEPEARISPRDMVKDIRAVSLRGKVLERAVIICEGIGRIRVQLGRRGASRFIYFCSRGK